MQIAYYITPYHIKYTAMTFTKNQIVGILLLNLSLFGLCFFNLLKWIGVSPIRTAALLTASGIFLFFFLLVLRRYYSLLFKNRKN